MTRHAAFLRGINVGRAKRVAMADLRALCESLGYRDVITLLNSGNVVFSAPPKMTGDHAARIEKSIASKLGVVSRVIVLTDAELAGVMKGNLLHDAGRDPARLLVALLGEDADRKKLAPIASRDWSPGAFAAGRRAAYLWCPEGILKSPLLTEFGKAMKDAATTRNWTTMRKIYDCFV